MKTKLVCAAGAALLLSASISFAITPGGLTSGVKNASALAPIDIASRHSSSSSSSSSSSARSSSARAASPSGSRWSARPNSSATRAYVVAPFRSSASPSYYNSTPFYARPHTRVVRRLAPLAALGAIYIGSRYYYPYRYLPYDGPVCGGITPNGCQMQWMEVPTEYDDGTTWQCVEFCPQE